MESQLIWNKRYNGAYKAVETLLSAWDKNAESIKSNKWDVANTVAATAISMILEAVLTDDPGGGGSLKSEWFKELAENLPTLLTAINAGKETAELIGDLSVRESYLLSLTTAVSALDKIISENQIDFDVYEKEYDAYVKKVQDHAGGIVWDPNYSGSTNYTALTLEEIKNMVKHKKAWDRDPKKNKLKSWYHIDELKGSSQASSFSFNRFKVFDPNWKLDPLPKKYKCGGGCGLMYETPVENMVVCPYPLNAAILVVGGKTLRDLNVFGNAWCGEWIQFDYSSIHIYYLGTHIYNAFSHYQVV